MCDMLCVQAAALLMSTCLLTMSGRSRRSSSRRSTRRTKAFDTQNQGIRDAATAAAIAVHRRGVSSPETRPSRSKRTVIGPVLAVFFFR